MGGCARKEKIRLKTIVFHTSRCFGSCPSYHVQIDSDRTIFVDAEYVSNSSGEMKLQDPDTARMGYFKGRVSERLYRELEDELQNIGLGDLEFDGITCCDRSVKTLIIYYNGKRKVLESVTPTKHAAKLIDLLRYIIESTPMKRTSETFVIEKTGSY